MSVEYMSNIVYGYKLKTSDIDENSSEMLIYIDGESEYVEDYLFYQDYYSNHNKEVIIGVNIKVGIHWDYGFVELPSIDDTDLNLDKVKKVYDAIVKNQDLNIKPALYIYTSIG